MFGTLRPQRCGLAEGERDAYDRFYCGLCKSLGDGFGQASRALVSHDAVFLAMLVDALSERAAPPDRCRCPLLPVVHRPTVDPGGVAMRFASAVEILLGDQYLADRALEGKRLAKLARPFSRRYVDRAEVRLADLGVDFSPLRGFEVRQADCEVRGKTAPAAAAKPTEDALAYVFGTVADLPGVGEAAKEGAARSALARLGGALGAVIYLADALDDLEQDFTAGDFNPCVSIRAGRARIDARRVDETVALLRAALAAAREALASLPLARHRELLESVVTDRLPRAARQAIRAAQRTAEAERSRELERLASLSWGRRLLHRALVLAAFVLAWLLRGEASAQPAQRPKPKPSEPSASASASADPSAGPFTPLSPSAPSPGSPAPPDTPDTSRPAPTPSPTSDGDGPEPRRDPETNKPIEPSGPSAPSCTACGDCIQGCESCIKGCTETCSKCPCGGESCKGCDGCCNGCDGCKNPCDGCCKSCDDPCKGCCDCGKCDCGKGGCC